MLVLTRKKEESIMIGDNIEIVVVEISPNQVRLGVKAPKNVSIYRKEIFEVIGEENRKSVESALDTALIKEQIKAFFEHE
ncbi:MAG: carbon storage regulator CsrA [Bacillota bacterium]|uniref:Translational regulator CsrA n=1 Tax=Thermanaerosceptrum fracticalcis TaxID=1712410 RepID=A0A7G6E4A5_THEFR|nr:carbon storage regulator CsrA [Thermanaerosceptrum fracticalcis]QNB46909.1 carbon storage regulator CsrA [Thermanaerosceptrum fracticalcis]